VRALLSEQPDLDVVGPPADHHELLGSVAELVPDVVITDIDPRIVESILAARSRITGARCAVSRHASGR